MQEGNLSPVGKFFRNKWVWLTIAIDIIALVIIISIYVAKASATATISFNVAPIDAIITINGSNDYKNNGQAYSLASGTYEIQISHADLDSKTFTINLEANHNTEIVTFLSKDGDFSYYTLKDNFGSFYRLADIASAKNNQTTDHDTSAEDFIAVFQKNYDFMLKNLPIVDKVPSKYGANYGTHYQYDTLVIKKADDLGECTKTLCLYITDTTGEKKEFALSIIRNFGLNPDDFQIIYKKADYD